LFASTVDGEELFSIVGDVGGGGRFKSFVNLISPWMESWVK